MLMVLHIAMRHGMTGPFIEDMLKFINVLLGEKVIPTYNFTFKSMFNPKPHLEYHFFFVILVKHNWERNKVLLKAL